MIPGYQKAPSRRNFLKLAGPLQTGSRRRRRTSAPPQKRSRRRSSRTDAGLPRIPPPYLETTRF